MREALKLTRAETARRAGLTPSEYAHIERPDSRMGRYQYKNWRRVRQQHLAAVAIVLGTTADYIATGKTDHKALPPNDPRKALLAEIARERKRREKAEKQLAKIALYRHDDAKYLCELVQDPPESLLDALTDAAAQISQGNAARPGGRFAGTKLRKVQGKIQGTLKG